MARRHRVLSKPTGLKELPASAPKELSKLEFGRRLQQILLDRGWTQSDLARQAFGETTDQGGYKVPKKREVVSAALAGRYFPSATNLHAMAKALGMTDDELLPNLRKMAIDESAKPAFEFKVAPGHPNEGWLQINQLVTYDTFVKIAALLQQDRVTK